MVTSAASDSPLLLDTSVLSLFFKTDQRSQLYAPDIQGRILAVSFITIGELYRWTIERKWGQSRIRRLEARLNNMVKLPWHDSVARHWAQIQTETPKSANDAWIAACARAYGCTLVTNDNDFSDIRGLQVISHANEGRRL